MGGAYGSGPMSEFMIRVGLGFERGNGYTGATLFGSRASIDAPDIVMNWGDGTYTYPADAAETLELVAPPGLVTIMRISGLGPDLVMQDPVFVETNGTTPVAVPGTWSRINSLRNVGGAGNEIAGSNVILRGTGGGTPFAEAGPLTQRSAQAIYTVPAGHSALVISVLGTMEKTGGAEVGIAYSFATQPSLPVRAVEVVDFSFGLQRSGDTSTDFNVGLPNAIPGGTNIVVRGNPSTNGQIDALVRATLLVVDNELAHG